MRLLGGGQEARREDAGAVKEGDLIGRTSIESEGNKGCSDFPLKKESSLKSH